MTQHFGRKRIDPNEVSVQVTARVTTKTYDALYRRAKDAGLSLSALMRRELVRAVGDFRPQK